MLHVRANMAGVRAELAPVFVVVPELFKDFGFECFLTSCVRPDDLDSFHGYGLAADFDALAPVAQIAGHAIADRAGRVLGLDYTCLWHKTPNGNWHLHVEFDPGRRGLAAWLRGQSTSEPEATPPPASGSGLAPTENT